MQLNSDLRARLEWMFENQPELVRELANGQLAKEEKRFSQAISGGVASNKVFDEGKALESLRR